MSWLDKLRKGFGRTSEKLGENLSAIVAGSVTLDQRTLDEIEEALIASDLGPGTAARIAAKIGEGRYEKTLDEPTLRRIIADELAAILAPVARPLEVTAFPRPHVILVVGVNGSGKTTTIAKLAHLFTEQDYKVMLAAGDTFRAAAIEQLQTWGERAGVEVVAGAVGADAAGLAFDALKRARSEGADVLIVDTAGRLQNKSQLMDELAKVKRVLGKIDPAAPHDVVLVLDATVGQNAFSQIEAFRDIAGVTGLIMTKLDGTARGGVLVAAAERYGLPIHAVGVGETMTDLRPFDPKELASAIAGAR